MNSMGIDSIMSNFNILREKSQNVIKSELTQQHEELKKRINERLKSKTPAKNNKRHSMMKSQSTNNMLIVDTKESQL